MRLNRMAKASNQSLKGAIYLNDKLAILPENMSFEAMQATYANKKISNLWIGAYEGTFDGSVEAFNECLDFLVDKASAAELQ